MVTAFHSPAPWQVNASGGARTIVAADSSVVAVVVGSNGAAPFEVGNGALMAASPDLRDALLMVAEKAQCGCSPSQRLSGHRTDCWMPEIIHVTTAALAKAEGR